jgi:hypothetical protein
MDSVHGSSTSAGVAGPRVHRGLTVARTEGTAARSSELASSLCGGRKLAGGGATERGEPGRRLTEAWAAVWQPGDGD